MSSESTRETGSLSLIDQSAEDEVELEKTRLLFRNVGLAQGVTVINSTVLVYILGGFSPPVWAIGWWLAAWAVAAARFVLARRFFAADSGPLDARLWKRRALLGALVAGLVWGAGGAALMIADPVSTRLFAALVMSGMVAGAVPILSAAPAAFRAYALPVMLPVIATAALDSHGHGDWLLAFVASLFMYAILRSARYFQDSLDSSIRLAIHMRLMAEQLEEARRAAEAASIAKSRFLATMSHEIRTPMNGILGMAQLLLMSGCDESESHEYARTILNSGQTLLTLLNDVLDLSKVEAGKFELNRAVFDPGQIVGETAALFAEMARNKDVTIEAVWHGADSTRYWGDPVRLRQMLSNLVNNAIKFTWQGYVRIEAAQIDLPDHVPMLEFVVVDNGMGIPEDKQSLLFQPFSQVDASNTREFGGTGLGLSITKSLAQLMGGHVGIQSEVGKGSRFWFRIPADVVAPGEEARQLERDDDLDGTVATVFSVSGRRILLVEDNPVNRKVMEAILVRAGASIDSAENGQQAVDMIKQGVMPDLVLMDCQMPVMDGFAATREIRRWEQSSGAQRLPIVALTARVFEDDRERCLAAGMDDFLTKPVAFKDLDAVFAKWLASS
jgi:signal transduction histidine kinase/ActR/RegA family two-component response regulator